MKTITLLIAQASRYQKIAAEMTAVCVRCNIPFKYYVTLGGYAKFVFTFEQDFLTMMSWCNSRGLEGEFADGVEKA